MIAAAFTDVIFTPANNAATAITVLIWVYVLPVCKDLTLPPLLFTISETTT